LSQLANKADDEVCRRRVRLSANSHPERPQTRTTSRKSPSVPATGRTSITDRRDPVRPGSDDPNVTLQVLTPLLSIDGSYLLFVLPMYTQAIY
jgi:hypothetical protein